MEEAQKKKAYKRPLVKAGLLLLLLLGLLLFLYRYFQASSITVSGCSYYTKEQIEDMIAGGGLSRNTLYLFFKYKYFPERDIPFIEKISVSLLSHDAVRIMVYEKAAIACVEYMSEFLYFDKDGVIVESSPERIGTAPVVSGVNFREMTLHEPLAVEDASIFKTILELSQLVEYYQIDTDRIAFNSAGEVTLYSGEIKILLGKQENYDIQLAQLPELLLEAKKKKAAGTLHMENYQEGQSVILKEEE